MLLHLFVSMKLIQIIKKGIIRQQFNSSLTFDSTYDLTIQTQKYPNLCIYSSLHLNFNQKSEVHDYAESNSTNMENNFL